MHTAHKPALLTWSGKTTPGDSAMLQARTITGLPFIHPHVALMPGSHLWDRALSGAVIPMLDAVIPAAVPDIGCGITAVMLQWSRRQFLSYGSLDSLRTAIEDASLPGPHSSTANGDSGTEQAISQLQDFGPPTRSVTAPDGWQLQLGTLGGGSSFAEISCDDLDRIWVLVHAGSRGAGRELTAGHIRAAAELDGSYWCTPPIPDLAWLPEASEEFWAYFRDARWAEHFAQRNREVITRRILTQIGRWCGQEPRVSGEISCKHSFTAREIHAGRTVWVTRNGAIRARAGDRGIIAGSMAQPSYIVTGKGCAAALDSAPAGAGRALSRTRAREQFTPAHLTAAMDGISWRSSAAQTLLDEHPAAYKPIGAVLADSRDLVNAEHELRQLISIKG